MSSGTYDNRTVHPDSSIRHRMAVEPTDLADRVALRLKELGISANKATSLAGLATGYVTRIRNRDRKTVSPELLEPLAAALKVHFDWLQRGVGEKEIGADPPGTELLPERAAVALRVVAGRGHDAKEALGHLQRFSKEHRDLGEISVQDWVAVALGRSPYALQARDDSPRSAHYDHRYPAREQAIRLVVDAGEATEDEATEAADAVAVALSSDEDLTVLAWVDDIRAELRRLRRGGGRVGARQVTTGEAQAEQDETARRFEDALRKKKR